MESTTLSGAIVARLHEEELGCMVESGKYVLDLKKLLSGRVGYSRFRQRLLSEDMGELPDDMPARQLSSLQLVILDFCVPEMPVWEALCRACENFRIVEVEKLLKNPLDPNGTGAAGNPLPLLVASEHGHLDVVRLLLEAGADTKAADATGATAMMHTLRRRNPAGSLYSP